MKKIYYVSILFVIAFFITIFSIIILNELYHFIKRQYERLKIFDLADKRAKQINKPLIVIGDPYNGIASRFYSKIYKTYGCGDETIDLTGAPRCPNGIKNDVLNYLKTKPPNSGVIFISCVLEYVDNISDTIEELYRVSGSKDNLFIVCVNDKSLSAYIYKDNTDISKNLIYIDNLGNITYKKL